MWAVLAYTILLNLALNSDLLLLRQFALSAPGVDATAAAAVAGNYEALRTFALLPYQTLLVVTFVIFPLVSRATFAADREATRAYVTQTMRYALILAGLMGIVLAARPAALFGVIYKPELRARGGGAADPRRGAVLPGAAVRRLLDPERGRANARDADADGGDAGDRRGGRRAGGAAGRARDADADRRRERDRAGHRRQVWSRRWSCCAPGSAAPAAATVVRVGLAMAAAVVAARLVPGHGKVVGLAVMALAGIAYVAVLIVTREFGPEDRAKFAKVFKR